MRPNTPAIEIAEKDRLANAQAMEQCLDSAELGRIDSVLDVRYGLGGWAKTIRHRYPNALIVGYERDRDTAQKAWKDSAVKLNPIAWVPDGDCPRRVDLILADFNTVTVIKRAELDELMDSLNSRWVIFTDVACGKLHLNYRSYGLESPSLDEYWRRFEIPGYQLSSWKKVHHAASTALFQRKNPGGLDQG